MHSQFTAGAVWAPIADSGSHIKQAYNSIIGDVTSTVGASIGLPKRVGRDVKWGPVAVVVRDQWFAAEEVWIRHQQAALRTVDFEVQAAVLPDIPGGRDRQAGAAQEGQNSVKRCGNFYLYDRIFHRSAADGACRAAHGGLPGDARNRPQQVHQLRDIVRADVQHRAAAAFKEELGIRMPVFHPMASEKNAADNRPADPSRVDGAPASLVCRAEEGVG